MPKVRQAFINCLGSRGSSVRCEALWKAKRVLALSALLVSAAIVTQVCPPFAATARADITYGYDPDGQLVCVTNTSTGNQSGYVYDAVGNLQQIVSPCTTPGDSPAAAARASAPEPANSGPQDSGLSGADVVPGSQQ